MPARQRSLMSVELDLSGPFFKKDPSKTFRQNVRQMLQGLADEGEEMVKSLTPVRSGFFREGVKGRVRSLSGKPWMLTAVVSQTRVYPWGIHGSRGFTGRAEAQYRGGKLEKRYRMFRRTASAMRRARPVLAANLTEGLS